MAAPAVGNDGADLATWYAHGTFLPRQERMSARTIANPADCVHIQASKSDSQSLFDFDRVYKCTLYSPCTDPERPQAPKHSGAIDVMPEKEVSGWTEGVVMRAR